MGLRQRQPQVVPAAAGDHAHLRPEQDKGGNLKAQRLDQRCTRIIGAVLVVLLLFLLISVLWPSLVAGLLDSLGVWNKQHAVILDAGSTGTRIMAYTFYRSLITGQLHLEEQACRHEVKPGLSHYATDPAMAAQTIAQLMDLAKESLPSHAWIRAPVTLKATAGLRMLPPKQADAILEEVEKVLRVSGFKTEENLIEIMNPRDEGLFAWFTLNYLSGLLSKDSLKDSFAALDLGGGSTQITFFPNDYPVSGLENRKHFLHRIPIIDDQPQQLYSHSYLGLGLMVVRQNIFSSKSQQPAPAAQSSSSSPWPSLCFSASTPLNWSFSDQTYLLASHPDASYEGCLTLMRELLQAQDVHRPQELAHRQVAVFSYFYDRAIDVGILPEGATSGVALVSDFIRAAQRYCQPTVDTHDSLMCVDLTFISSLLVDGYGLAADKELHLFKRIRDFEVSWALGLAYNLVH